MPNSLKAKLSNLRYKGQITDAEYKELIDKLNGHDRQILDEIKAEIDFQNKWLFHVWCDKNKRICMDDVSIAMDSIKQIIDEKVKEHTSCNT